MKITKAHYANSLKSQKLIHAAMTALSHLNLEVLAGNTKLRAELDRFAAGLQDAKHQHQEVIDAAEAAKNSVDPNLITRCLDRLGKLQGQMTWAEGTVERKKNAYERRLQDALTARIPIEQFRPLDTAPTQSDEIKVARERALLQLEYDRIQAFLGTVPLCDFTLLVGTQLERFIPGEAV
jgi:hypothetical protein